MSHRVLRLRSTVEMRFSAILIFCGCGHCPYFCRAESFFSFATCCCFSCLASLASRSRRTVSLLSRMSRIQKRH